MELVYSVALNNYCMIKVNDTFSGVSCPSEFFMTSKSSVQITF